MKLRLLSVLSLAMVLVLALATVGCEDTPLLAPTGSSMTLVATPATAAPNLQLDPTEQTYFSTIGVQMLDGTTSAPLSGVSITFFSSGGNFAFNSCTQGICSLTSDLCPGGVDDCPQPPPGPLTIETDSAGVATVRLAVTDFDDTTVNVQAISGAIAQTIGVANPLGEPTSDPEASISISPESPLDVSGGSVNVIFRSTSSDPDGAPITCYKWQITSTVEQTFSLISGDSSVTRPYDTEQALVVFLEVTDDPNAATVCDDTTRFSPLGAVEEYLVCDNEKPNAVIRVLSQVDNDPLNPGVTTVTLTGIDSSDPEMKALSFSWDCDNGQVDTSDEVTCTYVQQFNLTQTKNVTLTVTDPGNGESDCAESSTPASEPVTVPPRTL